LLSLYKLELSIVFVTIAIPIMSNIMGEEGGSGVVVALLFSSTLIGMYFKNIFTKDTSFEKLLGWGSEFTNSGSLAFLFFMLLFSFLFNGRHELFSFLFLILILFQFYISISAYFYRNPD